MATKKLETAEKEYSYRITEVFGEMDGRERLRYCDSSIHTPINNLIEKSETKSLILDLKTAFIAEVHNEHSKNEKDYKSIVFITKDGESYSSSSNSLIESFKILADNCLDADIDISQEKIEVRGISSRNREGKHFLKCFFAG